MDSRGRIAKVVTFTTRARRTVQNHHFCHFCDLARRLHAQPPRITLCAVFVTREDQDSTRGTGITWNNRVRTRRQEPRNHHFLAKAALSSLSGGITINHHFCHFLAESWNQAWNTGLSDGIGPELTLTNSETGDILARDTTRIAYKPAGKPRTVKKVTEERVMIAKVPESPLFRNPQPGSQEPPLSRQESPLLRTFTSPFAVNWTTSGPPFAHFLTFRPAGDGSVDQQ